MIGKPDPVNNGTLPKAIRRAIAHQEHFKKGLCDTGVAKGEDGRTGTGSPAGLSDTRTRKPCLCDTLRYKR